ncbi:MAG: UPF0755 protein [Candidatus Paceibacteria bacterium]|jgi:UPF0755 protein
MNRKTRILVPVLLFVLFFSVFYTHNESKPSKVVFIDEELTSQEIVNKLYEEGFIQNKLSYWMLSLNAKFNNTYALGGFELQEGMGALALHARLIDPVYKYVYIEEGLRTEEIAKEVGELLSWDDEKVDRFSKIFPFCSLIGSEGYLHPGKYAIHKDEGVNVIKNEMNAELYSYIEEVSGKDNPSEVNKIVTIASLIQREAGGKNDMRLISGIIWNRLEQGMPLQLDATLQYVKGDEELWWPRVHPKDKYLESPYNTYQNKGLPPTAIANPGKSAVAAALSPIDTSCLFYLHDARRNIHCSATYDGHKQNIDYYLR